MPICNLSDLYHVYCMFLEQFQRNGTFSLSIIVVVIIIIVLKDSPLRYVHYNNLKAVLRE